jgi:hypothetical protein
MELSTGAKKKPRLKIQGALHGKFGQGTRIRSMRHFGLEIFFHPDYTVGAGISPVQSGIFTPEFAGSNRRLGILKRSSNHPTLKIYTWPNFEFLLLPPTTWTNTGRSGILLKKSVFVRGKILKFV